MVRSLALVCVAVFITTWLPSFIVGHSTSPVAKSRGQQCKDLGYDAACKAIGDPNEATSCVFLICGARMKNRRFRYQQVFPYKGVQDKTECGKSKICRNRVCVETRKPNVHNEHGDKLEKCVRINPSGVLTRHEQCQRYGFDVACPERGTYSCTQLKCAYNKKHSPYAVFNTFGSFQGPNKSILKPMERTWCGDYKRCINGKCTSVPFTEALNYKSETFASNCRRPDDPTIPCTIL